MVVSTGSKQSIFNACFVLFGPGDEVLIPTPSWTSYYEIVTLARAEAVAVYGDPANGLKVTAESLAAAATPRTKGVMLNSPCNPTGAVYDRNELEAIVALCEERGWWLISDEIYRRISYGEGPALSLLELARSRERLIITDGVAKAYAMTGWRIGWTIAPRAVSKAMTALHSHITSNPAVASQNGELPPLTRLDALIPQLGWNISLREGTICVRKSDVHDVLVAAVEVRRAARDEAVLQVGGRRLHERGARAGQ